MTADQLPLFDPRTRVRPGDPETSHAAAESLDRGYVRASQQSVLLFLRICGPMTDAQLVRDYSGTPAQSPSGLRTRRSELTQAGLVRDSGRRVRLPSGRYAIEWEVQP